MGSQPSAPRPTPLTTSADATCLGGRSDVEPQPYPLPYPCPSPNPHLQTLLAKAVANQTSATFLRVTGSELIQKYMGDGPKLVRELFRVAEEQAPTVRARPSLDSSQLD